MTDRQRARWLSLALMLILGACQASPAVELPLTECVGRIELRLPGAAEVAVQRLSFDVSSPGQFFDAYEFSDGARTGGDLRYAGELGVGRLQSEDHWSKIILRVARLQKLYVADELKSIGSTKQQAAKAAQMLPLPVSDPTKAVSYGIGIGGVLRREQAMVLGWRAWLSHKEKDAVFDALDKQLTARPVGQSPQREGVCVPHFFIPDDGSVPRSISMTYRLVDHPDFVINVTDATARKTQPGTWTENAKADRASVSVWEQVVFGNRFEKLGLPWLQTSSLAGYAAVRSKMRLTVARDNNDGQKLGDVNLAYLTLVRGDPDAAADTPDLELFISQATHYARAQGKQPLDEAEFFRLAEAIRASVRRRPVQAP